MLALKVKDICLYGRSDALQGKLLGINIKQKSEKTPKENLLGKDFAVKRKACSCSRGSCSLLICLKSDTVPV